MQIILIFLLLHDIICSMNLVLTHYQFITDKIEVIILQKEFERFIITKEIRFKHAKGMRDIIGKELHTYHEIFFFMGGEAEFISEHGTQKLLPNTTVVIPKDTFHCFIVHGDERDYCRCVLNFENVSELDKIIANKLTHIFFTDDKSISALFAKIRDIEDSALPSLEKQILLKAFFAEILVLLNNSEYDHFDSAISPVVERIITYINENISKELSVSSIAEHLYMSDSYLAHVFKKELRIPIHKYILKKRLILANKKIKNGIPAMRAALESGFQDYSGFYRQYKSMFGFAPTDTISLT